jgi:2-hydroxychromene-2-carboxylate isomerase
VLVDVPIGPISEPAVELRAAALRLPLVWPERFPVAATAASRVALYATKAGRAPAFVLACSRLAFCGGFDLSDPEILAEAAAAAGLPLDECARAARDDSLDDQLRAAGLRIRARGAEVLPALSVGRLLFGGEEHIPEAAAAARSGLVAPLAHTRS